MSQPSHSTDEDVNSQPKAPNTQDAEHSALEKVTGTGSRTSFSNKEVGLILSRSASPTSTARSNPVDEEKGLPANAQAAKDSAAVTDTEHDPNVVDWDGDDDPDNPYNWPARKKWQNIATLSALTLLTPLGSSFFAPGVPRVMADFQSTSEITATFVVSVYLLGFAIGPIVIAPLSELYGRLYVYHVSNLGYLVFTVACALATNMDMLIGFRFLAGCFGVASVTLGGGTVADVMHVQDRGLAMSLWACGALLGPILGPVAGGFLSAGAGWRWIFWVLAIAVAVVSFIAIFTIHETYAPVLLARKTKKLRKETGNMNLRSKLEQDLPPKEIFVRAIARPTKLLFLSPICALMSLYMAIVYGILYLLFTTFTFVFQEAYGFSESIVGLTYLGIGIGNFIGLAALGYSSDRILKSMTAKYGKEKPEFRLPPLIYGSPFIPVGLFIYGWTAQYSGTVHWIAPLLGTGLVGIGMIAAFMSVNTYLVDCFGLYAASAIAANTILRSVMGAVFPLFGLKMYSALGLGWGNSLLGFVSLALCAVPVLFYYYGERLRTSKKFQIKF